MGVIPFHGLSQPYGRYREIFDYVLRPDPEVKSVDLCCGLGFSKTTIAIQIGALTLDDEPGHIGMFLEPDWDRIHNIFLPLWDKHVPRELYHHNIGKNRMEWHNGSILLYRPRVITGSKEWARARTRGIPTSFVIDDETAIGFDEEQYQNTFARIREKARIRYYLTLTTPLVGPYGRFLKRGGNKVFRGRTRDNHYLLLRDPTYEQRQRANMSEEQARRELDGELVALEGRIWKTAKPEVPWPEGNRHDQHTKFDPSKPWWLFCDFGSSTGAYAVVQQADPVYLGREVFRGKVWVAVADYCPDDDASASRAFQKLKKEFGTPVMVTGGADQNKREDVEGRTIAGLARQVWSNVTIMPVSESVYDRQLQYDRMSYLVCSALDQRRFCVAKDFVSLDERSKRGVREMLDEDAWPPLDKRRQSDFLPKNPDITVQHIRDALLMGSTVMSPPDWSYTDEPAG